MPTHSYVSPTSAPASELSNSSRKWPVEPVARRDYPVLQGGVLLVACVVMGVNLFVDVLYGLINPRIRYAR